MFVTTPTHMDLKTKVVYALFKTFGEMEVEKLKEMLFDFTESDIETAIRQIESSGALELKSFKPQVYGNQEINQILDGIKLIMKIEDFTEDKTWQRRYGNHIKKWIDKNSVEKFREHFIAIYEDSFKRKNMNSLKYIYNQIKAYIPPIEEEQIEIIE